jgi:hypothetical protein
VAGFAARLLLETKGPPANVTKRLRFFSTDSAANEANEMGASCSVSEREARARQLFVGEMHVGRDALVQAVVKPGFGKCSLGPQA